ncbi:hypothetical protein ACIGEI_09595 [Pseudomonas sp. NPDC078863]|uniref:hypothetical protein n=1 Tax=unclassified Pseudomonas TaxID=196821 RepID=UPI0037C923D5
MNATELAQSEFDNRLPPPVSESPREVARSEWLYNAAEQLVRFGCDVSFQRRMRPAQGVTLAQFALAVDEHVNGRLADCEVTTASLGYLLIAAERGHADKVAAAELLGTSDHPLGKLGEIAEGLLRPLVDDALIAQAEDNEL